MFGGPATVPLDALPIPEGLTLLTYMFLHGDPFHLAANMLFLWVFGDNVEDAMGHLKFLAFYLVCGISPGSRTHCRAFLVPDLAQLPLIGASGAVAGVIAAYLMLHPRVRVWVLAFRFIPLRISAVCALGVWVADAVRHGAHSQRRTRWRGGRMSAAWWQAPSGPVPAPPGRCRCSTRLTSRNLAT